MIWDAAIAAVDVGTMAFVLQSESTLLGVDKTVLVATAGGEALLHAFSAAGDAARSECAPSR